MPKVPPVGAVANRAYGVRVASILPNAYKTDANARSPPTGFVLRPSYLYNMIPQNRAFVNFFNLFSVIRLSDAL